MSEQNMITLVTRKQMDIYMNPQRQRLLKAMEVSGVPMTPKQLSNVLKISASSVSLHIRKLEELGLPLLFHAGRDPYSPDGIHAPPEQIAAVAALLKENAQAYTNFQKMPASVKKTYTRAYLDAKTEAGRSRRLAWMMDRLENNLKPMCA